ncbi:hypothetical protein KCP70_01405 [Salmonella enterica subsp. enterica]|nr:hypothetical protein KCP70_01405 [Salmonella enterica subsp. enterica]
MLYWQQFYPRTYQVFPRLRRRLGVSSGGSMTKGINGQCLSTSSYVTNPNLHIIREFYVETASLLSSAGRAGFVRLFRRKISCSVKFRTLRRDKTRSVLLLLDNPERLHRSEV